MKNHHVMVTVILIGGAALVYVSITYTIARNKQHQPEPVAIEEVATTTEATSTEPTTEPAATPEPKKEVQTIYQPVYVPTPTAPTPTVEITNGVKSEGESKTMKTLLAIAAIILGAVALTALIND